jgi:hypothetical protein
MTVANQMTEGTVEHDSPTGPATLGETPAWDS